MLVTRQSTKGNLDITPMLRRAHQAGLVVHPYTFRLDKGRVAKYADNFADMLNIFYYKVGVDGVFTDFPDKAVEFLKKSKK
jgi:glycerophosphoryl diester phosphodiesterase